MFCHPWVAGPLAALLALICSTPLTAAEPARQPNILFIIADDLGWHDIGYHDSDIHTPNLDKLAKAGVRLERNYVYPTCSPTRAGVLTGRNASRFGIKGPIDGRSEQALPKDAVTLSRVLHDRGYETALCGKWHLGLRPEVGPRKYGFDHSYGYLHGQIDQLTHRYKNGDRSWHRNDEFIDEEGHATDLITDDAVKLLRAERTKPLFLWVAYSAPHTPLQEVDKWVAPYRDTIKDASRRLYAASVSHMDAAIGRLIEAVEKSGKLADTMIVFTSDNGGQKEYVPKDEYEGKHGPNLTLGNNLPWRGWKGGLYEGGIRVPAFVYWKDKLKPATVEKTVSYLDWFPTLCLVAGVETAAGWKLEGRDIWPLLTGQGDPPAAKPLYWDAGPVIGILDRDWKLVVPVKKGSGPPELYNLADDPYEKKDLAAEKPDMLASLRKKLEAEQKLDK